MTSFPFSILFICLVSVARTRADAISFSREIEPIFVQSCNGCHHPGKEKGGLDLTSFASVTKGGKHGALFTVGATNDSRLIESIAGAEPAMPKNGTPLPPDQAALIARWIVEGARDDTPSEAPGPRVPPIYTSAPAISAIAYSPDGHSLAVAGFHEVILLSADTNHILARLVGASSRIESLEFSPDAQLLAVAGGSPGLFGEAQIWEVASGRQVHAYKAAYDSIFGLHWSPDGSRIAFGCADRTARILRVADGKELVKFDQHSDWVLGAVFLNNNRQIVTGSRDRSLKLVDAATGSLVDVLNRDTEPIQCFARHPKEDWIVFGSEVRPRLYKAAAKPDNNDPNADPNAIREFDHFDNGVTAVAFSPDGKWLASAGLPAGEARVHEVANGRRKAALRGHEGAVFALSFSSDGSRLATAGYEGVVRVFDWAAEKQIARFIPVPLASPEALAKAAPVK